MPPKEEFAYNVKAVLTDGNEVELTELEGITLTEMEEVLEKYDFVRVVRCRDCIFYWEDLKLCCNEDGLAKASEETYCPYGERRTE